MNQVNISTGWLTRWRGWTRFRGIKCCVLNIVHTLLRRLQNKDRGRPVLNIVHTLLRRLQNKDRGRPRRRIVRSLTDRRLHNRSGRNAARTGARPTTLKLGRRDPSVERRAAPRATRLPSAEVVVDLVVAAVMVGTYTHAHFIDPGHRSAPRSRERSGGGGQVLRRHCKRLIMCGGTTSCFTRIAASTLVTALHAAASSRRRGGGACGGGGDDSGGGDDGDLDREGGGNSGDDARDECYCGSSGGLKPDSLPLGVFDGDAYARSCAFTTLLVTAAGFVVRAGCFDPLACLLASHVHVRGRAPAVEGRRHVRGWTRAQIPLSLFRPAVTPRYGRRTSSPPHSIY